SRGESIVGCQRRSWVGRVFFTVLVCTQRPPVKISPLPCLLSCALPSPDPLLPYRRAAGSTQRPTRPSLPGARGTAAAAALRPSRIWCRSPASRAACRDSGSGADLCAATSPPPLSLSPMPPSLQGAGEIGAEDKKQRFGHGGLELLGRWRRPSWFVMEAAPPASWLRYVSENQICTMPPHPLRLLFHPFESFLAQRNEEWIHEAWRKRRCQPGHDARVCPSPLKHERH
uniref:Uncharacterized protein n=2 Tax=Aegilops tauschii subsp. strangulata TaxID=200361 RepID=A0A453CE50_AEGTS